MQLKAFDVTIDTIQLKLALSYCSLLVLVACERMQHNPVQDRLW